MTGLIAKLVQSPELLIPRRRPLHPLKLNKLHPLAKGLVACYVGHDPINLVTNISGALQGSAYCEKRRGLVVDGSNATDYLQFDRTTRQHLTFGTDAFLICVRANLTSSALASPAMVSNGDTGSGQWMYRVNSSLNPQFYGDVGGISAIATSTVTLGQPFNTAFVRVGSTGRIYFNGVNEATDSSSSDDLDSADAQAGIGGADEAATRWWTGNIEYVYAWKHIDLDRAREIINSIEADPYQFLEPANSIVFPDAIAAGITGTGSLSAQAAQISGTGEITKTGTGALTAQDAGIDGSGTVTPAGGISGSGALSAQASAISGVGIREITGSGSLTAQDAQISGGVTPPVPRDISWKGGGRVMRKGDFPEWWKEEEEPQPKETAETKKSTAEQIAELAETLPIPKPKETKKVVPLRKKTPKKAQPKQQIIEPEKEVVPPSIPPEIQALQSDMKEIATKMTRMEKRLAAALLLLLRNMRR